MQVKHKRYEANFTQLPSDSSLILKYAHQCVLAKYTEEQIQNPKPEEKTDMTNISVEAIKDFLDNLKSATIIQYTIKGRFMSR